MSLSGGPRIDGHDLPRASIERPVSERWVDETDYERFRSGRQEPITRRLRGRFTFGYRALGESDFAALTAALRKATFDFTPRTAIGSEDPADERTFLCRCLSDIPESKPLYRTYYAVEVELETIHAYDATLTKIE